MQTNLNSDIQIVINWIGRNLADIRPDLNAQISDEYLIHTAILYLGMMMNADYEQFSPYETMQAAFAQALLL